MWLTYEFLVLFTGLLKQIRNIMSSVVMDLMKIKILLITFYFVRKLKF